MKVRFAEFTLDSETRQLLSGGQGEIRLSPKAFDLLRALLERRPNVVEKSELHNQIWPATFVVDANLNVLIAEIRRALGDDPRQSRFIRTVHGVGYAFRGETVELDPRARSASAGAARFWLLWNDRAIVLAEGENIVGRDPQCHVWLDASGVSRRHARIHVTSGSDDAVVVEDLGSKNGTLLLNAPIMGQARLTDGDLIRIGSVELKLRVWSEGKAPETERIRN